MSVDEFSLVILSKAILFSLFNIIHNKFETPNLFLLCEVYTDDYGKG